MTIWYRVFVCVISLSALDIFYTILVPELMIPFQIIYVPSIIVVIGISYYNWKSGGKP